jgi:tRNA(fMet)-specific endonuclease VapC
VLLLDTDAISNIQYGKGERFESLARMLNDAGEDVYVSVISLDEQLLGAFKEIASSDSKIRIRGYRRLRDISHDYCDRPMLDYDEKADLIFNQLKGLKGRPATKDLRIASIALVHHATLVTGNVSDFEKIPSLMLRPMPK